MQPGEYTVRVSVDACTSQSSDPELVIITGVSGDEIINAVRLHPNPATNRVVVELPGNQKESSVSILTVDGKVLEVLKTRNAAFEVNLSAYPAGVYLVHVYSNNRHHYTKLVKY